MKRVEQICLLLAFHIGPPVHPSFASNAINSVCAFTRKSTAGINQRRQVPSVKSHPRGLIPPSLSRGQRNTARYRETRRGGAAQGEILLIVDQIDPRRKSSGDRSGERGGVPAKELLRFSARYRTGTAIRSGEDRGRSAPEIRALI